MVILVRKNREGEGLLDEPVQAKTPALESACGNENEIAVFGAGSEAAFPPCRGPQAALKRSYCSDRVTRERPMALRVRASGVLGLVLPPKDSESLRHPLCV